MALPSRHCRLGKWQATKIMVALGRWQCPALSTNAAERSAHAALAGMQMGGGLFFLKDGDRASCTLA